MQQCPRQRSAEQIPHREGEGKNEPGHFSAEQRNPSSSEDVVPLPRTQSLHHNEQRPASPRGTRTRSGRHLPIAHTRNSRVHLGVRRTPFPLLPTSPSPLPPPY